MDVSTPPSLDLACPQAKPISKNMSTCLEIEVSMKIKIRTWGHHDQSYNNNTYILTYDSYAKVTIHSQCQVWIRNFIENQQTMISVIEAIAFYRNIGKSQHKSFSASLHTQLSYSPSQLLTLMQYLWLWSFNRTQRKIGAYGIASQLFTSGVMSTVIDHENLHPSGYICQDLSNTMCLPKDKI